MPRTQSTIHNRLLKALTPQDFESIAPHLESLEINLKQMVTEEASPISHVCFPESGVLSLLARSPEGRIEVGMVGREGAVGVAGVFGAARHPHGILCQAKAEVLRIAVEELRRLVQQSPSLAAPFGLYLHFMSVQIGQSAYANATLNIEARLARWILMTDDRVDGFELTLTHEFLSMMLGTHRPGVTTAVHVLEGAKMIRAERGTITVVDRSKLEELASDAYGTAEAEYERLFG